MTTISRPVNLLLYCLVCLSVFLALASGLATAATAPTTAWEKSYGGADNNDKAESVWQTSDCGFIICGETDNGKGGLPIIFLTKTDWQGNLEWTQTYPASSAKSVKQTSDGGYIVAGSGAKGAYLLKTSETGAEQWSKAYPRVGESGTGDDIYSVHQLPDGNYVMAGNVLHNDKRSTDMYLAKVDGSGNMIWQKTYGSFFGDEKSGADYCYSVWPTSDGGSILGGSTMNKNSKNMYQAIIVKVDADGNQQWFKTFDQIDGRQDTFHIGVQQTHDGGYIWSGGNGYHKQIVKADAQGNMQWYKVYDKPWGGIYSIQQTWDDGYIFVGGDKEGQANVTVVTRTDSQGNVLWEKELKGVGISYSPAVLQIGNGSYVVAGHTKVKGGVPDTYLAQLDKDFTPVPDARFVSPRDAFVMDAGKSYYLTLVMTNNGTMPWTFQDGTILAPSSDSEDMKYFNMTNYTIPIGTIVRPGQSINVNFTYTAPEMNGTYHPEVRMFWTNHGYFGEPAKFTFYVVNGTPDTRTPTAAVTAAPTSAATTAPDVTATPGPTDAPDATPVKTGGLPCLSSVVLPLLVVGTVGLGLYRRRNKEE
ncbi:hypothetical protein RRC244 [Methanocella arvoryzae MRE50]|uniref:Uncharacterized protein n=1 Tax=Methanocella arvoryzae (strain DSM 22066 / NBRC 105507 / MRE50) TaxID=351160 RepID=Q0W0V7_METAR|nr:hypothetical protein RRC244 [Methanocella arvoryzae MRE50]